MLAWLTPKIPGGLHRRTWLSQGPLPCQSHHAGGVANKRVDYYALTILRKPGWARSVLVPLERDRYGICEPPGEPIA